MHDVIKYSNMAEDHISHVYEMLTTLAEAAISLKMERCKLFSNKVEYLGHVIHPGKMEVENVQTAFLRQPKSFTTKS